MAVPYLYLPYSVSGSGYIQETGVYQIYDATGSDGKWNATMANFWVRLDQDITTGERVFVYNLNFTSLIENFNTTFGNADNPEVSVRFEVIDSKKCLVITNTTGRPHWSGAYGADLIYPSDDDPMFLNDVETMAIIDVDSLDLTEWNNFHIPLFLASTDTGENTSDQTSYPTTIPSTSSTHTNTLTSNNGVYVNGASVDLSKYERSTAYAGGGTDFTRGTMYWEVDRVWPNVPDNLSTVLGHTDSNNSIYIANFWLKEGTGIVTGDNFYDVGGPGEITFGSDGTIASQTPTVFLPFIDDFNDDSRTITPNLDFSGVNNATIGEEIDSGSLTISSNSALSLVLLVDGGVVGVASKTTIGTDVSAVDEYVETPYADYVDVDYYDAGYAQNDPYVQQGYVGDEAVTTIASFVTVSDTVNYTSDSAVVALGGNSISAELDVSGQGAITIDAKATLASEVDLTVQSTMSASAGLVFSQTTTIAAETAQTQTVGLVFSQSTDLAADFVSSQLGGNLISAGATPVSDAQLTSDSDVLQGGILDVTSTTELNAVGGYVLDAASSVAADVQFTGIAESIPFIDETLESDFALSATGANDVSAELDVTGQGAITITASATTGSDVELAGQFQFSAIAELDTVAQATISTQAQLDSLGGLLFEADLSVASDFASTQTAAITTNNDVDLVSNSNFAIDTTVLIGGILDTASEFVVLDIEPSLFVGGVTNIFQGTSIVTVVGSYLYDVPLIRRLVVAPDSRLASISPESRILGVKSESRINTIITETRGLKVPQDNRTHKIYDGSL